MSVIIYSKNNCIYCQKSKELFKKLNIPYNEILLNKDDDNDTYTLTVSELINKYNHKTFPFIIINETFIGGYTELENAYNTLYLHKLLNLEVDNDNDDF